ncbi:very-long-chain 3-oxoacyl-CoA synthase [Ranunculus cassubicifolius]
MDTLLHYITTLLQIIIHQTYHHSLVLAITGLIILYKLWNKTTPIYLLDFVCYKPSDSYRVPISMFIEHLEIDNTLDEESRCFQTKMLEKSGFGDETHVSESLKQLPITKRLSFSNEEAETVILSIVQQLLDKNNLNPKSIDILITNCSMFSPTPSLSSMIVNKFGLRSNIKSFNLSGMGCSAGIVSVSLARDLLRVHPESLALVVSTEILSLNWYYGKNRSMLLTNCLFRMGGVALLMSSGNKDKRKAKYELQHLIRTNKASEDRSYQCVFQDVDDEGNVGVSLAKDILHVAGDALKTNIASLGPLVLPYSELFKYGMSFLIRKVMKWRRKTTSMYTPNFKKAFEHFCIHAGGRGVIQAIEVSLGLSKEDVEASNMTLYRFGNTSSSSIWYELCYIEAKGKMKSGDRVWQIAFGSGFKCNSAVWKCVSDVGREEENAWMDRIHLYPVDVPAVVKN